MFTPNQLRNAMQGAIAVPDAVIEHIYEQRWLQIWVPTQYGGLGYDFEKGLNALYEWAKIDGSLGWMLTLCSGANYFSRNIEPNTAKALFANHRTCFGGSGMIGGTAEQLNNGDFCINGQWQYATGAPYLSHFTLNATVVQNGIPLLDTEGNALVRSFVLESKQVEILPDWKSMGMRATGTYSFKVVDAVVSRTCTFVYNAFYCDDIVNKIPFRIFADLTLLVNYLGIAHHYIEEAEKALNHLDLKTFYQYVEVMQTQTLQFASKVEEGLQKGDFELLDLQHDIHLFGVKTVQALSHKVIDLHMQLGIKGTQIDQPIHQVFTDFFTATMHRNFRSELEMRK